MADEYICNDLSHQALTRGSRNHVEDSDSNEAAIGGAKSLLKISQYHKYSKENASHPSVGDIRVRDDHKVGIAQCKDTTDREHAQLGLVDPEFRTSSGNIGARERAKATVA